MVSRLAVIALITYAYAQTGSWNGNDYMIVSAPATFEDAQADALARGGFLCTVESQEENDAIMALASANNVSEVWLGGTNDEFPGDWTWNGGELDGVVFWSGDQDCCAIDGVFNRWHALDPNTGGCFRMKNGFWGDQLCNNSYSACIEWENTNTTTNTTSDSSTDTTTNGTTVDADLVYYQYFDDAHCRNPLTDLLIFPVQSECHTETFLDPLGTPIVASYASWDCGNASLSFDSWIGEECQGTSTREHVSTECEEVWVSSGVYLWRKLINYDIPCSATSTSHITTGDLPDEPHNVDIAIVILVLCCMLAVGGAVWMWRKGVQKKKASLLVADDMMDMDHRYSAMTDE